MFTKSTLGTLLASIGAIGGAVYAFKTKKPAGTIAIITVCAGLAGYVIGNSTTQFFAPAAGTN